MKALILSGGMGIRLRPLTHTLPKQLIPIANRPILFCAIETLAAAGIDDIGIVVGDTATQIQDRVGDGDRFGVSISYIVQDAPRGLAHAVLTAQPFIGTDEFVVFLGDNLLRRGIRKAIDAFTAARADTLIMLAHVNRPEQFGIAEFERGRLTRLVEKPLATTSDLAVVGVYVFNTTIFDAIARIDYSDRGELEITDAIQRLVDDGRRVATEVIAESPAACASVWQDAGSFDGVLAANRLVFDELRPCVDADTAGHVRVEGIVVAERGAVLRDCVVRGPSIIGAGSVIERAVVGPHASIAATCTIRCAEVEDSVVLEGTMLENVSGTITASLIGRRCLVRGTRAAAPPTGSHRRTLLLGDDAQVELS